MRRINQSCLWNRWTMVLLSFLLPFALALGACVALGVTPFGDNSLAISDGQYYINNLMFLRRMLLGQENWLYSLKNGLGGNEWSILAWGGLAPAYILTLFADLQTMPQCFTWICLCNFSLCGLTMFLLLSELHGPKPTDLVFSTSYALMGYNAAYCFLTLFFIGVQLLPLVALGLVRLFRGKSPALYLASLSLCIFFNFYFGYMLCVVSVALFLANLYVSWQELDGSRRRIAGTWAASSVLAGLLPAFFWLPALKAYSGGGRMNQTPLSEFRLAENMPFTHIFAKLFSGAHSTQELVDGLPNIFCGIMVVALVIVYFLNRGTPNRRKKAVAALLGFYLLTFYIKPLTLVMHGFTDTNWFPYRYAFVFSFLLIGTAAEAFAGLSDLTLRDTLWAGVILLGGTVLVFCAGYDFIGVDEVLIDLGLLLLMWAGFFLYHRNRISRQVFKVVLMALVCVNLLYNFTDTIRTSQAWELPMDLYKTHTAMMEPLIRDVQAGDPSFFRLEQENPESESAGADAQLYGYHSASLFGAVERRNIRVNLNRLGMNWYRSRHWYSKGITPATDALLGLKYIISNRDLTEEKGYRQVNVSKSQAVYQNENALQAAVLVDSACLNVSFGSDAFHNLNLVWESMTGGTRDVLIPESEVTYTLYHSAANRPFKVPELQALSEEAEPETVEIRFSFPATQDGPVYRFDASIPESESGQLGPAGSYCGTYRAGETVSGTIPVEEAAELDGEEFYRLCSKQVFAYVDNSALADYAAQLNARDITFNVEHDNQLNGTFTAEKNQRILFTIPWDEGWTCYIDGEKVPIVKTWDLFMSVEAPEGEHTYEMKFFPAWMDIGLGISGAALVGFAVLMVLWKRSEKARMDSAHQG